ncbi:gamma-glutamyltransferase [Nitrogeniibacter mangrovi]|uniref:Glutathione hydrolase proenzyme n=1 Tax=Nitrogeniibacter mangrovi TaxID=2016596 RepID=A0A6C1B7F5_9RHOO|nr:gamma-glutamyltransferase [Nitrogeniibacter mangrovi]QID18240.1 gamma-glutamyltransferase [Nitrogeniibacter mangrovi]
MTAGRWIGLCFALVLAAATPPGRAQQATPEAASGVDTKPAVRAHRHMAVTANPHATDAALQVLREGGSATDAAVAAALVLNVVEPQSSGIGGGGFMLVHDARRGRRIAYDGRERAPAAADDTLFLDADGKPMAFFDAVVGGRSVGVPGLLRMLALAHRDHGRLPWARLVAPAIRLAQDGFAVSPRLHALLAADRFLADDPGARALFYDAQGRALAVGTRLRNPALAEVLRKVAANGPDAFYTGSIARDIVARVRSVRHPGRLSLADLRDYRAMRRPVLCGPYRQYTVCGMPPPSSGGGTVLEILGLLTRFDLPALAPGSAFAMHLFAEAGRLAFADRDAWYGDPATMAVSPRALIAPAYLKRRAARIDPTRAHPGAVLPGRPEGVAAVPARSPERPSTSHLSIVDDAGNAVALTASIENAFGSRTLVDGFLLNNQLTDFSFSPRGVSGPHPNRAGSRRQPRSSMSPTLVYDARGQLYAVLGSPGGSHIINYVAATVVGLLDWHLPPDQVLAMPHVSNRNRMTEVEDTSAGRQLATSLATLFGQAVTLRDLTSGLHVIVRDGPDWVGAADPRREGTVGVD